MPRIAREVPRSKRPPNERHASAHLAFIRLLPCLGCGRRPPSQAAHLRFAEADDPHKPGAQLKPADKKTVPLCDACHKQEENRGKITFWGECQGKGISDPLGVAAQLWKISGSLEGGFRTIQHARPGLTTAWLPP